MLARFRSKFSAIPSAVQACYHQLRFVPLLIAIRLPDERRTDDIHIVFTSPSWRVDARLTRAASKAGGNVRPRFVALLKIPAAAFMLKKYLFDTCLCRTADKEHATAALCDSPITAVQHAVADHRPALPKSLKDRGHISPPPSTKEPWDIFKEAPRRLDSFGDPDNFPEEAGALSTEAFSSSGNTEVLAGEASAEEINRFMPVARPLPHVRPAGNVWPSSGEDPLAKRLSFDLIGDGKSGAFKPKVKPSNPGKKTDRLHYLNSLSPGISITAPACRQSSYTARSAWP